METQPDKIVDSEFAREDLNDRMFEQAEDLLNEGGRASSAISVDISEIDRVNEEEGIKNGGQN